MDVLDKFFTKYSYKFPKGYPDLKDKQDILLMESILEELGLNEVKLERDDYVSTPEIELVKDKIYTNKPSGFELSHIDKKRFYFKGIPGRGAYEIRNDILNSIKDLFPNEEVTITPGKSGQSPQVKIEFDNGKDLTFYVKGAGSKFDTSTAQKEGLVIFFYNSDIKDLFTPESLVKNWKDLYNGDYFDRGLEGTNKKQVKEFLSRYNKNIEEASKDKVALDALNDPLSSALFISGKYGNENDLITGEFTKKGSDFTFEDIRKDGKELSGLSDKDKWNPGDVYLQLKDSLQYTKEEALSKEETIQPVAIYNKNFVNIWGKKTNVDGKPATFVSISLKQTSAAAGKGKGFLKGFDPAQAENTIKDLESTYNLTDDEKKWDEKDLNNEINNLKDKVEAEIKGHETDVEYTPGPNPTKKEQLISKYASLKLLYFICLEMAQGGGLGIAKSIAAIASYAASLTGVNPTFFKITGKPKGTATIERFAAESSAELTKGTKLKVIDKGTAGGIQVTIGITKLDPRSNKTEDKKYMMNIRSNGTGQNTIELTPSK